MKTRNLSLKAETSELLATKRQTDEHHSGENR